MRIEDICESLHQGLNTAGQKVKFVKDGFPIIQTRNIDNDNINTTDKLKFLSKKDLHPLVAYAREHSNLIITPHIAGLTFDSERKAQTASFKMIKEFIGKLYLIILYLKKFLN